MALLDNTNPLLGLRIFWYRSFDSSDNLGLMGGFSLERVMPRAVINNSPKKMRILDAPLTLCQRAEVEDWKICGTWCDMYV